MQNSHRATTARRAVGRRRSASPAAAQQPAADASQPRKHGARGLPFKKFFVDNLNLKHCHFKSHDTCALCDHSKPRAFLSFLNVFECCYRTRHQAFLLRTKREVSSDKRVQKCKHQLDSIRRLIKNGRNRYTCGVSSVAQQRGMAYSAERIGSEQHALDCKKRHTEKDDLQRKTKRMKNHKQKQEGWCKDVSPWQPETQNARSNKQSVQEDQ